MDAAGALTLDQPASTERPSLATLIGGLAALAISVAMIWLVTREIPVVLGFGSGVLALGGLALALARRAPTAPPVELALPDWSV